MDSLEKKMYFIPNRLFIDGNSMYVSFNIAVIPEDMVVTSMVLYVPIQVSPPSIPFVTNVDEIASGWDEKLMYRGFRPPHPINVTQIQGPFLENEIGIDIKAYAENWRFKSRDNHGLCITVSEAQGNPFLLETPPYLVVSTI